MLRFVSTALVLAASSALAAMAATDERGAPPQSAGAIPDVLKKTIAYYSTLASYADTGTMRMDQGYAVQDARFTTYFRRSSRDFYFDYQPLSEVGGTLKWNLTHLRTVVWMFKGEMQKYEQNLPHPSVHEVINAEGGGQVRALGSTNYGTKGASIMIPSLLYSQARLPSAILQVEEAEAAGFEDVNKRRCHKVVGVAAAYYPSGQRTAIRPVTIWIDAETQLIRRVFEDTPKAVGGNATLRYTFTFEPQANPAIDDSKFQFKVPAGSGEE